MQSQANILRERGSKKASQSLSFKLEERVATLQKKAVSKQPLLYALFIIILMAISFCLGYFLNSLQTKRQVWKESLQVQSEQPKPLDRIISDLVFPANHVGYYTETEKRKEAERLFRQAATYSGEQGEGRQGWLHLLAAYSYDKSNPNIVSNLIDNYHAVHYDSLAYSTLLESELPVKSKRSLLSEDIREEWKEVFSGLKQQYEMKSASLDPGKGCTSLLFNTVIGRWNLDHFFSNPLLNQHIYEKSVEAYHELKRMNPTMSATDLNHQLFRVQMNDLDSSNSFWNPLVEIPSFSDLVLAMRLCAIRFLRDHHGWNDEDARRKASHSLIVWVSVHTETSTHQPHVTEDALIGGVYYVKTPEGSGPLDLYDPRGKHPLYGLQDPPSPPEPPFHRTHSVRPKESTLVLFPGWLVHSVRTALQENKPNFAGKYRVSMSLNLKGEWIDTSNAAFGCPTETL